MELTIEEAGERYLDFVCESNAAKNKWSRVAEGLDPYMYSDSAVSPKIQRLSEKTATAVAAAAQGISDPDYLWPEPVRKDLQLVGADLYEQSAWYASVAEADTWADTSDYRSGAKASRAASAVRLALGLPPRGEGCPGDDEG